MAENVDGKRKVVIELDDVRRDFIVGGETVHALRGVSFKICEGEFVTIMGKSGSGKCLRCLTSLVVLTRRAVVSIILTACLCVR